MRIQLRAISNNKNKKNIAVSAAVVHAVVIVVLGVIVATGVAIVIAMAA